MAQSEKKYVVIDGNSIVNRAFYGIRLLSNAGGKSSGRSSGSVHGLRIRFRTLKTFNVILVGKPFFVNPFCSGVIEIQRIHLFSVGYLGQIAQ